MVDILMVVAAALVDPAGKILMAQRPAGKNMAGKWEFPGGKVEPGESPELALSRELREELGIRTDPATLTPVTFASHRYETFHLLMPLFLCRNWQGTVTQKEHQALDWVAPEKIAALDLPPADYDMLPVLCRALKA